MEQLRLSFQHDFYIYGATYTTLRCLSQTLLYIKTTLTPSFKGLLI